MIRVAVAMWVLLYSGNYLTQGGHRSAERRYTRLKRLTGANVTCRQQFWYYQNQRMDFFGQEPGDQLMDRLKSIGRWQCRNSTKTAIIDIGANIGQDNEFFVSTFGDSRCWGGKANIYLFEPNRGLFPKLKASAEAVAKKGDVNFEFINAAATNYNGTTEFNLQQKDKLSAMVKRKTRSSVTLPAVRLDAWVREQGITRVPFLKIDTEGFDPLVLQGAEGILPMVEAIFWECHAFMERSGSTLQATTEYLWRHGFASYVLGLNGSAAINPPHWHRYYERKQWQNCFSVPRNSPLHTAGILPGPCTAENIKRANRDG